MTAPNLPLTVRLPWCASPRQVVVSSLPGDRSLLPRKTRPGTPHPSHPTLLQQPNAPRRKLPVHCFPMRND
jgi:hypothetical protein